jgi:hypothetical protein
MDWMNSVFARLEHMPHQDHSFTQILTDTITKTPGLLVTVYMALQHTTDLHPLNAQWIATAGEGGGSTQVAVVGVAVPLALQLITGLLFSAPPVLQESTSQQRALPPQTEGAQTALLESTLGATIMNGVLTAPANQAPTSQDRVLLAPPVTPDAAHVLLTHSLDLTGGIVNNAERVP